jgi:hypothetical protein
MGIKNIVVNFRIEAQMDYESYASYQRSNNEKTPSKFLFYIQEIYGAYLRATCKHKDIEDVGQCNSESGEIDIVCKRCGISLQHEILY